MNSGLQAKPSKPIQIHCESTIIGDLSTPFESDQNWHATISFAIDLDSNNENPIVAFVRHCIDWHRRIDQDPSPSEFDKFNEIIYKKRWTVELEDGTRECLVKLQSFSPKKKLRGALSSDYSLIVTSP